ncbi:hypothetical protein J5X84_10680 [Streptosporangiaceae bacterium NEAU-GS5]|nr:hypothetical protein [Streptosporangiaceae bacterium NEAU-GS5]
MADTMVIHHFALADRIDVLGAYVTQLTTTYVVESEIRRYLRDYPSLTRVGRNGGIDIHGTIWLLTRLSALGKATLSEICELVDVLRATGMRLPCTGAELPRWARDHSLL